MKPIALVTLLSMFYLSLSFAADSAQLAQWEVAAQKYLNDNTIEIYFLEFDGEEVSFKYDDEHPTDPYLDTTYECVGVGIVENGQPSFSSLECEEEEPTLWDEL